MPIERLAVGDQVLEFAGGAVAGADQDEDSFFLAGGDLDERQDAVAAQVGIDGEGVGLPGGFECAAHGDLAQVAACVRFGGRADVVALTVDDHDQALFVCVGCGRMHGGDARRAIGLIERGLKFDRGNEGRDDIDDVAAETVKCLGNSLAVRRETLEKPGRKFSGRGSMPTQTGLPARCIASNRRSTKCTSRCSAWGWVDSSGFDSTI